MSGYVPRPELDTWVKEHEQAAVVPNDCAIKMGCYDDDCDRCANGPCPYADQVFEEVLP